MKVLSVFLVFGFVGNKVSSFQYDNVTKDPVSRQLYDFKLRHPQTIGLMTTSAGEPVEIRDTVQLNSDQFTSQYHLDLHTTFDGERVPARVVHAKGVGAYGYLVVTNDVTQYTSANLFNNIGKKTPFFVRLSSSPSDMGTSDVIRELKGLAFKFYTEEGNLDFLCLQAPIYFYKDATNLANLVHSFKRNPQTFLSDLTAVWDFITLKPETIHNFFWLQSDYGIPNGYRKMDVFPIHTYELSSKNGDTFYVKFNFRTEQGIDNLTSAQAAEIQGTDLDYYTRDLYNAIARKDFPTWRLEMDVMTADDIKNVDYDPFDVTKIWRNGTYKTVQIGRIILNRIPDNIFSVAELSALNPSNLVPGIPGPVDSMFRARRFFYRDTQNYRLGRNHNKIDVNMPRYAKTYNRDGRAPVRDNMKDVPVYYPNSFSGPMPYVDETRPKEKLLVLQGNTADFQSPADFYNHVLKNDAQRQRLVDNLVVSLTTVNPPVQERAVKFMYLIDRDLGKRVDIGLKAALVAARANQS